MATLQTNYVQPGSVPAAIDTARMDPSSAGIVGQAQTQGANQLGAAIQHAAEGMNYMLGEEKRSELRTAWRNQKEADKDAAEQEALAQKQKDAVDKLYSTQATVNYQLALNKQMNANRISAQPGGNLSDQTVQDAQNLAKPHLDNAPSPEAAQMTALSILKILPHVQKWGTTVQNNLNVNSAVAQIPELGQVQAQQAQQDPSQAGALSDQVRTYSDALKQGLPADHAPHIDTITDKVVKGINHTAFLSLADKDPQEAQRQLEAGVYPDATPADRRQLTSRINNNINGEIKVADKGLDSIQASILGGMQAPSNVQDLLDQAHATTVKYQNNPNFNAQAQILTQKQQVVGNLMAAQQELVGSTPEQLHEIQLGMLAAQKNLPGDPVTLQSMKLINNLVANRQKLFKNSPMEVEQVDGTIKPNTVDLDLNLNTDQGALSTFVKERTNVGTLLSNKYGPDALPFSEKELTDFATKLGKLDPVAKLDSLDFINKLPTSLAQPLLNRVADKSDPTGSTGMAIKLNQYDPKMAQAIVEGQALMGGPGGKLVTGLHTKDVMATIGSTLGPTFQNDPMVLKQGMAAAQAITARDALTSGTAADQSALEQNFKKVMGIDKVKYGGFFDKNYNTITPFIPDPHPVKPGDPTDTAQFRRMTGDEFKTTISKINDLDTLKQYGNGVPVDGLSGETPDPKKMDMSSFKWLPVADGRYQLALPTKGQDRPLTTNDGKPYIFNMKQYLTDQSGLDHG